MLLFLSSIATEDDRDFCEALYYRHRSAMFFVALSYLNNNYDAEDVVQTVFCEVAAKYIDKLHTLDPSAQERFLLIVTKYRALDIIRKNSRIVPLDEAAIESELRIQELPDDGFVDEICRKAEYEELRGAIETLDPDEKALLWMRFVLDLSSMQISDVLGVKHQTVIKRLQRTKRKLVSIMDGKGVRSDVGNEK